MALPLSGPLKMGDIRTELGMSGVSNFSLINASVGGVAGYPILNPYSPVKPTNTPPEYKISEWYGYSSATINWTNGGAFFSGVSNLKIYVNGVLRLNDTNPLNVLTSGTLVINNNDSFYATVTPITFGNFTSQAYINTFRLLSPFNFLFTLLNQTTGLAFDFSPISSPPQTATIQAVNLGVYEIYANC
jgi:hypothetical protein